MKEKTTNALTRTKGKTATVPALKPAKPTPACKVLFSPKAGISKELSKMTQAAAKEISVAAYAFSSKYLGNALVNAMKRGVKVRLIMDKDTAEKAYAIDEWLIENSIDVRFLKVKSGCMHHKFLIIDRARLMTGSYNFTNDSEFRNHEAAIFIDATASTTTTVPVAAALVNDFTAEFERLWSIASTPSPKAANSHRRGSQPAHRRIPRLFGGKG
ncbi:MAG: phospholipase D-like domain-containing protein [Syntrophales bacterium]|jgi:phosphatidylserine/phosphatidylglycerophosphate/cardiolipin synthase-like enzyme